MSLSGPMIVLIAVLALAAAAGWLYYGDRCRECGGVFAHRPSCPSPDWPA